eukprot:scaffold117145_cov15-Tisochrysis_lutea.AAC.1
MMVMCKLRDKEAFGAWSAGNFLRESSKQCMARIAYQYHLRVEKDWFCHISVACAASPPCLVTCFTDSEERAVGKEKLVPFLLESKLKELGGQFECAPDWHPFAVRDGNL